MQRQRNREIENQRKNCKFIYIFASLLLASLLLHSQTGLATQEVIRRHDCNPAAFIQKSNTLIFVGNFESFDESPSPRILDSLRERMIQFECEDIPVSFYVPKDAKLFLSTLSKGDRLKIYGYHLASLGAKSIVVATAIEQIAENHA
jgi:hypothetical protein